MKKYWMLLAVASIFGLARPAVFADSAVDPGGPADTLDANPDNSIGTDNQLASPANFNGINNDNLGRNPLDDEGAASPALKQSLEATPKAAVAPAIQNQAQSPGQPQGVVPTPQSGSDTSLIYPEPIASPPSRTHSNGTSAAGAAPAIENTLETDEQQINSAEASEKSSDIDSSIRKIYEIPIKTGALAQTGAAGAARVRVIGKSERILNELAQARKDPAHAPEFDAAAIKFVKEDAAALGQKKTRDLIGKIENDAANQAVKALPQLANEAIATAAIVRPKDEDRKEVDAIVGNQGQESVRWFEKPVVGALQKWQSFVSIKNLSSVIDVVREVQSEAARAQPGDKIDVPHIEFEREGRSFIARIPEVKISPALPDSLAIDARQLPPAMLSLSGAFIADPGPDSTFVELYRYLRAYHMDRLSAAGYALRAQWIELEVMFLRLIGHDAAPNLSSQETHQVFSRLDQDFASGMELLTRAQSNQKLSSSQVQAILQRARAEAREYQDLSGDGSGSTIVDDFADRINKALQSGGDVQVLLGPSNKDTLMRWELRMHEFGDTLLNSTPVAANFKELSKVSPNLIINPGNRRSVTARVIFNRKNVPADGSSYIIISNGELADGDAVKMSRAVLTLSKNSFIPVKAQAQDNDVPALFLGQTQWENGKLVMGNPLLTKNEKGIINEGDAVTLDFLHGTLRIYSQAEQSQELELGQAMMDYDELGGGLDLWLREKLEDSALNPKAKLRLAVRVLEEMAQRVAAGAVSAQDYHKIQKMLLDEKIPGAAAALNHPWLGLSSPQLIRP